jgi:hypothetical protein
MSDETKKSDEAAGPEASEHDEHGMGPGDIVDEVTRLGHKLGAVARDVWESDQRKHIQSKVVEELRSAHGSAKNLAHDVRSGRLGGKEIHTLVVEELRQAKAQVETLAKEVSRRKEASRPAETEAETESELEKARVHTEAIGRKLGEGILSGLRALNRELGKALEKEPEEERKEPPQD